ncbi:hypothetical protein UZ36_02360 [Candidatus Nitromaritima sp. SCGC AAA799-C22]|nr:hypothetical protein UZ36_02360 [Candidatus Nitromaritima sp. SCGC AAA799-C22]
MDEDYAGEIELGGPDLKKYRLAGYGFLALNILYVLVAVWKLPPVDPALANTIYIGLFTFIALALVFTLFILRGNRLLVQVLAVIYGARAIFSIYSLTAGGAFPAVPYLLPCVVITFYLLGRAAWDWP